MNGILQQKGLFSRMLTQYTAVSSDLQGTTVFDYARFGFLKQRCITGLVNRNGRCNRVSCIHVSGHDPLTFSFLSFFLFDWVGVLWPQLSKVLKPVRWASSVPFPPVSLQRQVVCLLLWPVFISGESLHCFLVGWCTNKSYSNL